MQAARKKRSKVTKVDVAEFGQAETENLTIEIKGNLQRCFEDGHVSCSTICETDAPMHITEIWSGNWTAGMTKQPSTHDEQGYSAHETIPYCIDSSCTSHVSPVQYDFSDLTAIPH